MDRKRVRPFAFVCGGRSRCHFRGGARMAKNPRALADRLRRAQTFLRTLGIEITLLPEGRGGTRMMRVRTVLENIVSTVSGVHRNVPRRNQDILAAVGE